MVIKGTDLYADYSFRVLEYKLFCHANNLPPLTDVDVTGSHIEHVARCIQGGAGPGASSAGQWQDYLLRYGSHSAQLCDEVAAIARKQYRRVVPY